MNISKYLNTYEFLFGFLIVIILIIFIYEFIFINDKYYENYENVTNLKQYNVIFAGTCRNVENTIEDILKYIDECGKSFNNYFVIIYENDSTDKTVDLLLKNKKENYKYIIEHDDDPRRTVRLSNGRNKILDEVKKISNDYDYLVMLDLDDANNKGTFVNSIESNFNFDNWDVLTGNQKDTYYDIWALREKNTIMNDIFRDITDINERNNILNNLQYNNPFSKTELTEVDSAFGGIAIYKLSSIPNHCEYNGLYPDGEEKCEHVDFHKCIKENGGKIYINPYFLNDRLI